MAFTETYNFIIDFTSLVGPLPFTEDLEDEIRSSGDAGLVAKFEYTELIPGLAPTDCLVTLNAALTGPEKLVLDAVIAAHTAFLVNPVPPAGPGEPNGFATLNGIGQVTTTQLPPWLEDEYTPTLGQVTFIITKVPIFPDTLTFEVNGIIQDDVTDFTRSGTTVTWLNTLYSLDTTDKVSIRYR